MLMRRLARNRFNPTLRLCALTMLIGAVEAATACTSEDAGGTDADASTASGATGQIGSGGAVGSADAGAGRGGFGARAGSSGGETSSGGAGADGTGGRMGGAGVGGASSGGAAASGGQGAAGSGGASTGGGTGGAVGSGGGESGGAVGSGGAGAGGSPGSGGDGSAGAPARAHCKRGVAYGYHSAADMWALSQGVTWWYNWAFVPDADVRSGTYRTLDVEYVPMVWGGNANLSEVDAQIPNDARVLLGFNEPNFFSQANLSASEAAALWPEVEAVADKHGLLLVSPAVNFCGGGCHDTDPFAYLHEFFSACRGCRVDAVAIHIYVGCAGEGNNRAQWLINHVERYKSEFSQPLWLTEFACSDAQNEDEQRAFMQDAVPYLENEPRIERYAWFAGRADNVPHVDLLGSDGQLTALGRTYVELPQASDCTP